MRPPGCSWFRHPSTADCKFRTAKGPGLSEGGIVPGVWELGAAEKPLPVPVVVSGIVDSVLQKLPNQLSAHCCPGTWTKWKQFPRARGCTQLGTINHHLRQNQVPLRTGDVPLVSGSMAFFGRLFEVQLVGVSHF